MYQTSEPHTSEPLTPQSRRRANFHNTDEEYRKFVTSPIENRPLAADLSQTQRKIQRTRPIVTATAASTRSHRLHIY